METDKSGVSAYKSGVDEGRESQEPTLALDSVANGSNGNTKVDDDDDDTPQLSAHTLAALQQFYSEQEALRELMEKSTIFMTNDGDDNTENVEADTNKALFQTDLTKNFPEDWQLSQFWYDQETSKYLANEVLTQGTDGLVACVSCPSIFRACESAANVHLFEYDKRFRAFGSSYHFYDYNDPDNVPDNLVAAFSVVVADPPFLSEECLEKVAVTVKKLMKKNAKVILCTGSIMEPIADRLLNLKRSGFVPKHTNNLGNEFACFVNYELNLKPKA